MQIRSLLLALSLVAAGFGCSRGSPNTSSISTANNQVPAIPTNLSYEFDGRMLTLIWAGTSIASSYNVYWETQKERLSERLNLVERVRKEKAFFSVTSLPATYHFTVHALGAAGESEASEILTVNLAATPVVASTALNSTVISADGSTVAYSDNTCGKSACVYTATYDATESKWQAPTLVEANNDGPVRNILLDLNAAGTILAISKSDGVFLFDLSSDPIISTQVDKAAADAVSLDSSGEKLAFEQNRQLFLFDRSGSANVTLDLGEGEYPDLSGDASRLVFLKEATLQIATSADWLTAEALDTGDRPKISADGTRIVSFDDVNQFSYYDFDGTTWQKTAVPFPSCCGGYVDLSNDGNAILLGNGVTKFDTGSWTPLATFSDDAALGKITADGNRVIFVDNGQVKTSDFTTPNWDTPIPLIP